ncbi:zinc-dependent alcohol dehydrogenase family protein [Telmatospirillum siberiense]|uniref:NADPH:quinone reductase n=1 Tax=Telmatospirillum siberiense TaxID=382514 RepID=A0A2N3Q1B9_9PROT|nr:zinc-dependent alcohol dehydrogenase family protein [Telmatospirillum siberiense]PKU26391.1 NADPH:quinone reductase [Telmatospirillum siberiense]
MVRVVRFHKTGGPEVLQIENVSIGAPGSGELRLRVHALGLNRAEAMFRAGTYLEQPTLPSGLGYEAAGTVEEIGEGVSGFSIGDKVSTIPGFSMNRHGVYGEEAIVPAAIVVKHPENLSWEEAAAIWMKFMTAYGALIDVAGLAAGEAVIITAASSSVGLAAIQIANAAGATSIAVTRTAAKRDALLHQGARHVIVTREQDLVEEVKRITDGKGARVIFDPVTGEGVDTLAQAAAKFGTIILYGALSASATPFPLFAAISKGLTLRGYTLFEVVSDPKRMAKAKRYILDGLTSGKLKPVIGKTFPFEQIVEAHRFLESNEQIGKIVVTVP